MVKAYMEQLKGKKRARKPKAPKKKQDVYEFTLTIISNI